MKHQVHMTLKMATRPGEELTTARRCTQGKASSRPCVHPRRRTALTGSSSGIISKRSRVSQQQPLNNGMNKGNTRTSQLPGESCASQTHCRFVHKPPQLSQPNTLSLFLCRVHLQYLVFIHRLPLAQFRHRSQRPTIPPPSMASTSWTTNIFLMHLNS